MYRIYFEDLLSFSVKILKLSGVDSKIAKVVAEGLCQTSLRGVDSHGIRLLPHYSESAIKGRKNPQPKIIFKKPFPSFGILDANHTFGHYACIKAVDKGILMAKKNGISAVSVYNSTHCGSMAHSALHGAKNGYIVLAFTNADSLMLSYNGTKPFFGTNPICVAVPRIEKEPFCLDMATTQVSWNKLLEYRSKKINFKDKVLADSLGRLTNEVNKATALASIGQYKGFGLAAVVEILTGVYSGMNTADKIPAMYTTSLNKKRKLSQFFIIMKTDARIKEKAFLNAMQQLTSKVRNQKSQKNTKVLMPNDPQINESKIRNTKGIPLNQKTFSDLIKLSKQFNLKLKYFL